MIRKSSQTNIKFFIFFCFLFVLQGGLKRKVEREVRENGSEGSRQQCFLDIV
jgi:hypothetical protein